MSENPYPPQPGPGGEQVPPPGVPPYSPPPPSGSGTDRFFDSIRRTGLARSEDRWVGGVAGGLAERLGWDALLVRGLLFLSFFITGVGLVAYGIGWALLPERRDGRIHLQQAVRGDFDVALVGAIVAVIAGLSNTNGVGTWWTGDWGGWGWILRLFWFAVWITAIWLLVHFLRERHRNRPGPGQPPVPPVPPVPPAPYGGTAPYTSGAAPTTAYTAPTTPPAAGSDPASTPAGYPVTGSAYATPPDAWAKAEATRAASAARAEAARQRAAANREQAQARAFAARQRAEARAAERAARPITKSAGGGTVGIVFGLLLVTGALLLAADRSGFRFPAPFDGYFDPVLLWVGISLAIVGAGIVISGVRGRSSGWLGFLAIVGLVVALPWSASVSESTARSIWITQDSGTWRTVTGGIEVGEGTVKPTSVAEAERGFRSQFGDPTIDLTGLDLSGATVADPVEVPIQIAAGDLTVVVPEGVAVEADIRLLAGEIAWNVGDHDRTLTRVGPGTAHLRSDQAEDDGAVLRLLVSAGAGNVTVTND